MRRQSGAKILSAILAAVLIVAVFSACGNNSGETPGGGTNETGSGSQFVYVPEYFPIPAEIADINNLCPFGEILYFTTYTYAEGVEGSTPEIAPFDKLREAEAKAETGSAEIDTEADAETDDAVASAAAMSGETGITATALTAAASVQAPAPTTAPAESGESASADTEEAPETEDGDLPAASSSDIYIPTGRSVYKLYKMNIDATGLEELSEYKQLELPDGQAGDSYINSLTVDSEGNIWTYENAYSYGTGVEDGSSEAVELKYVRKLDGNGRELDSIDVSGVGEGIDQFYANMVQIGGDGNIYLSGYSWSETDMTQTNYIFVYAPDGTELFRIEMEGWINNFIKLADGRIAISLYEETEGKELLRIIDVEKKDLGESYPMLRGMYNAYPGDEEYDLYFSDGSNLYGYNLGDEEGTKIVNWIGVDINGNDLRATSILPDGRIVCLTSSSIQTDPNNWQNVNELAVLTKKNASEVEARTVLTMATMYLDYNLRGNLIKFNRENGKYRIEVNEYEQYNNYESEEGYNLGLTKLSTEIMSGNIPDLLVTSSGLPVQQYVSKGILEDIYPYLENDSELSREDLVEGFVKATEIDGGLYQVSPSFGMQALVGSAERIGTEHGWTIGELMDTLARQPEGTVVFAYRSKADVLRQMLYAGMTDYVDWQTGKCSFNTEDFINLLEFANTYPLEIDWEKYDEMEDQYDLLRDGRALLIDFWTDQDLTQLQMYRSIFGGEIAIKGYPSSSRGGAVISPDFGIGITNKCKDKDGAWQFLRMLFTEEYQTSGNIWNLPTNKKALDKLMEEAMKEETYTDEFGNEVVVSRGSMSWGKSDLMIEMLPATQEDVDLILELINSASNVWSYDEELLGIILEEADPFFAGQKTSQATADIIQNRVTTYVNERR